MSTPQFPDESPWTVATHGLGEAVQALQVLRGAWVNNNSACREELAIAEHYAKMADAAQDRFDKLARSGEPRPLQLQDALDERNRYLRCQTLHESRARRLRVSTPKPDQLERLRGQVQVAMSLIDAMTVAGPEGT